MTRTNAEIVEGFFRAYREQNREAAAAVMSEDFRFTSPQDDHISKADWLERCFPTADRFAAQHLMEFVEVDDRVIVRYEYRLVDGDTYRNVEVQTVRDGLVAEVEVYFGGKVG